MVKGTLLVLLSISSSACQTRPRPNKEWLRAQPRVKPKCRQLRVSEYVWLVFSRLGLCVAMSAQEQMCCYYRTLVRPVATCFWVKQSGSVQFLQQLTADIQLLLRPASCRTSQSALERKIAVILFADRRWPNLRLVICHRANLINGHTSAAMSFHRHSLAVF